MKTALLPVSVLFATDLPLSARLLFFLILLETRESGGGCRLTLHEMAGTLGVSRSTIYRDLRLLISVGLIDKRSPREYVALDPEGAADRAFIEEAKLIIVHAKSKGQGIMQATIKRLSSDRSLIIDARPDFLKKKSTGALLEYDLYSAEYRVAFEFNGPQHYGATDLYPDEGAANKLQDDDAMKQGLSLQNGVKLIIVRPEDLGVERLIELVGAVLPLREDIRGSAAIAFLDRECYYYRRKAVGNPKSSPKGRPGSIRRFFPKPETKTVRGETTETERPEGGGPKA